MTENSTLSQPQSSSKRAKKSSSHETSEQLKSHLDSEKHLHEIQCFTEELFATRKASQSGQALSSYVDPVVNLHIDILLSRIKSLSNETENGEKVNTSAGVTALLQKLTSENESLRRKESVSRMNEKLSHKKVRSSSQRIWLAHLNVIFIPNEHWFFRILLLRSWRIRTRNPALGYMSSKNKTIDCPRSYSCFKCNTMLTCSNNTARIG